MVGQLLSPPAIIDVTGPIIFLAGPIQGALDWQKDAIGIIQQLNPAVHIASPRREYWSGTFDYAKQVDWETHFLRRAAHNGVVLFWLAREHVHKPERAYAQTSRFELAEWKVRRERDGIKLVIGIDEGFSNARYIRRRFSQDCPDVPIVNDLGETCKLAVEAAAA
jgi:hypothetical protein